MMKAAFVLSSKRLRGVGWLESASRSDCLVEAVDTQIPEGSLFTGNRSSSDAVRVCWNSLNLVLAP